MILPTSDLHCPKNKLAETPLDKPFVHPSPSLTFPNHILHTSHTTDKSIPRFSKTTPRARVTGSLLSSQKTCLLGCAAPPLIFPWTFPFLSNVRLMHPAYYLKMLGVTFSPTQSRDVFVTVGPPSLPHPLGRLAWNRTVKGWLWYHLSRGLYSLPKDMPIRMCSAPIYIPMNLPFRIQCGINAPCILLKSAWRDTWVCLAMCCARAVG